jgi:hypothetical protein
MTRQAQHVVEQAMTLPPETRREVVGVLLASLPEDHTVESPEVIARLLRRSREIHEGAVQTEPAREMIADLLRSRGSAA